MLYTTYTVLLTYWTYRNRIQGHVPDWVPLWMVVVFGYIIFPSITFAALRIGETGMDILKSLRPLALSLNPSSANTLVRLRERRLELSREVTEIINTFGPEMYADFDHTRIIADPLYDPHEAEAERTAAQQSTQTHARTPSDHFSPTLPRRSQTTDGNTDGYRAHGHLPRNESFSNLGNMGLFATRPSSRSRSRSNSESSGGGFGGSKGFSALTSKEGLEEVSRRIRGAMHERGKERTRRQSEEGSWEFANSGAETPGSEEGKKDV